MVNYIIIIIIIIIIFVFFLCFSYHSSCCKGQFTVLTLKFGYSRFYWSISTKDLADLHWFVVVALPSQVFMIGGCLKEVVARAGFTI